jgi:aldehyde:ferredoxin oxidoreductase
VNPGKLLNINLTSGSVSWQTVPDTVTRTVLGGRGLIAWYLVKNSHPDIDPLSPDNPLLLSCGLLTGSEAPTSSRLHLGARSPLTGLLGSSNVGGYLGAELQRAGIQMLVIEGKAPRPTTLWIDGSTIELRDASHLWGLDTRTATRALSDELGQQVRLAVIGVAGEELVRYACIMTGSRRAAGRTGMGAVMGAKNLKAIAVRGVASKAEGLHSGRDQGLRDVIKTYAQNIRNSPRYQDFSQFSNSNYISSASRLGLLATRNHQQVQFESADRIDGRRLIEYVKRRRGCFRCPIHCKAEIEISGGPYDGTIGERPDLEPIACLGAKCGLDDPEALLYFFNLSGDLGLDSISLGGVLAFAMELYQRGIISVEDTGGIEITWGNARAMDTLIQQIARRQGFGCILAEGVERAAKTIGKGAEAYAHHVKGLEMTGYDARGAMGTALGYAISNRGADFATVYAVPEFRWDARLGREWFGTEQSVDRLSTEGKGALVRWTSIVSAVVDSLGLCKMALLSVVGDFSLENEAALTTALAGWPVGRDELIKAGERILTLERLYNLQHGATPDDLPDRFTEERVKDPGPTFGMTVSIQPMVRDFYQAMGWDSCGRPGQDKLQELGLVDLFAVDGKAASS